MSDELLRVQDLCKAFPMGGGFLERAMVQCSIAATATPCQASLRAFRGRPRGALGDGPGAPAAESRPPPASTGYRASTDWSTSFVDTFAAECE